MNDDDLRWLGIAELAAALQTRQLSALELATAMLRNIERIDARLRAFVRTTPELALEQARRSDQRRARGQALGPLDGVPIALKDLCWTAGIATTAGMPLHAEYRPEVDGTVTRKLAEAGAVLLGKLKMTEGAFSAHHPRVESPLNPWDASCWTGVSSSGSAVAVAAGLCAGAIGTDTGGSIRFPSAANGVTGLKPTWGRVSRFGAFELAASLDHLGPICRDALDCGLMLAAIAGPDADDPTALQAPVPDYGAGDCERLADLRIGIDENYAYADVEAPVGAALRAMLDTLERLGARIVPVRMPEVNATIADWLLCCGVEAALAHADTFPARRAEYGPVLAGLLDAGLAASAIDYQRALLERARFTGRLNAVMAGIDLLIAPALALACPTLAQIDALRKQPDHRLRLQRFTAPFDMSGHPTLTLPTGSTDSALPVAGQLIAGHLREDLLVRAGRAFQQVSDWHRRRPPLR